CWDLQSGGRRVVPGRREVVSTDGANGVRERRCRRRRVLRERSFVIRQRAASVAQRRCGSMSQRVALVTGANKGIGFEVARYREVGLRGSARGTQSYERP